MGPERLEDETLYGQIGAFTSPGAHGRASAARISVRGTTQQFKRFLECTNSNFLLQVTGEPTKRGAVLDLVL